MSPLPKTIYLIGPQSTGKSTLTRALLQHYGESTPVVFEVARRVLKDKGYSAQTIGSTSSFQMQRDIFRAQYEAEAKFLVQGLPFISDRNAIDPIVYNRMYSSGSPDLCESEAPIWQELLSRYRNQEQCIVILLEPYAEFLKDDGTRRMPFNWEEYLQFGNLFKNFLKEQGIPCETLGEGCVDLRKRVERVVGWAEGY